VQEMIIHILAIVVLGLMCGSEMSIGAFAHRSLEGQPLQVRIPVRARLAASLGRVMHFWMAGSTSLNLLLLFRFEGLSGMAWRLAACSFAIQAAAVAFSLVGPVPINNRIIKWTAENLPHDWKEQERRWDGYHWLPTIGLTVGFVILITSATGV
jgi:Domain of unknown function (DUF1772)